MAAPESSTTYNRVRMWVCVWRVSILQYLWLRTLVAGAPCARCFALAAPVFFIMFLNIFHSEIPASILVFNWIIFVDCLHKRVFTEKSSRTFNCSPLPTTVINTFLTTNFIRNFLYSWSNCFCCGNKFKLFPTSDEA